jgi:hypothetical protein
MTFTTYSHIITSKLMNNKTYKASIKILPQPRKILGQLYKRSDKGQDAVDSVLLFYTVYIIILM